MKVYCCQGTQQGSYKLWLPPGHFGLLVSRDQSERRGFTILTKVVEPDQQEKVRLLLYNGDTREEREYVWNLCDAVGRLLVFPCPFEWTRTATPA